MRRAAKLPNFFGIGPMRAGSTSLHQYLRHHPDVFMSSEKETDYFSLGDLPETELPKGARRYRKATREAYEASFRGWRGEKAVGEVSPSYLFYERAAARLYGAVPTAKLICCLRDPIRRSYSHYALNRKLDLEPEHDFRTALALEPSRADRGHHFAYVQASLYDRQLARFFSRFSRSQIHVMLFEDFAADPSAAMKAVFEFLEVDASFEVDTSIAHNRSGVVHPSVRRLFRPSRALRWALRAVPPSVTSRIGRVLMTDLPAIDAQLRHELSSRFSDEISRVEDRLARDLSAWRR